jgi:membrane-bound serine protease (ClpP class)
MHNKFLYYFVFFLLFKSTLSLAAYNKKSPLQLGVIYINGVINSITERYIKLTLEKAENKRKDGVILVIDTPGGLVESTHHIVKELLNTSLITIAYISPKGARCVSAGVFIAFACDFIAMAPSTHIGAAHPVAISGFMGGFIDKDTKRKIVNALVAQLKSIAKAKNRPIDWAEAAVRKSASATEIEAKKLSIADFIAEDIPTLLKLLDKKVIKKGKKEIILRTKGAKLEELKMTSREQFFHSITNPTVAYILLMLGIYGLIYEFSSPGIGLGAVVGSICLILAFLAFQSIPINLAALFLILLGFILFILELKVASGGILTLGGIASLLLGSLLLIDAEATLMVTISKGVIIGTIIVTLILFSLILSLVIKAHKKKTFTGEGGMIGVIGITKTEVTKDGGLIFAEGEIWNAITSDESQVIEKGKKVKIVGLEGIRAKVIPL